MLDRASQVDPVRLLERAHNGDAEAVGELLQRYRPYLSLLARLNADRQLQGKLDDSDLVQDTCLSAHRDFAQFRGATEPEFTGWLRKIMAHTAANLARDHRRQRRDVRLERQMYNLLNESSALMERAARRIRFLPESQRRSPRTRRAAGHMRSPSFRPTTAKCSSCGNWRASHWPKWRRRWAARQIRYKSSGLAA